MSRKKVSTGLIEKYLDRAGWPKHQTVDEVFEKEGIVLTGWVSSLSPEGQSLVIDPIVESNGLLFMVRQIASAPTDATPADRLSGLLLAIAAINFKLIFGAFSFDPTDGELVFRMGVPIDSEEYPFEDFEHCLKTITTSVDAHASDLRGVIDGTKTVQDVIS